MKKNLHFLAGLVCLAMVISSCEEDVTKTNTLSVVPSAPLVFNASGNDPVTLTVTTDADDWSFTKPEWVTAAKNGNELSVNVLENASNESNAGRITFTAGNAKPVKINVVQNGQEDGPVIPEGKTGLSLKDESGKKDVTVSIGTENAAAAKIVFTLEKACEHDARIEVIVDEDYLSEYDYIHGTSSTLLPESAVIADPWEVTVAAGQTTAELPLSFDGNSLEYRVKYLLPLTVKVVSGDVSPVVSSSRVNYTVTRLKPKAVKQMVFIETNDVNPLNALEVLLEDGTPFFDAVVLFSGNLAWDATSGDGEGAVRFNHRTDLHPINGNNELLLAEWKTYLKPLRDAGIKVYMGLMPHHSQATLSSLSKWGAEQFAKELAEIAYTCQLDGYCFDGEYGGNAGGEMDAKWADPTVNRPDPPIWPTRLPNRWMQSVRGRLISPFSSLQSG